MLGHSMKLNLTLTLKHAISKAEITPIGKCPYCGHDLSEEDIKSGWNDSPYDFSTQCSSCNKRFIAKLDVEGDESILVVGSFHYLCPLQLFTAILDYKKENNKKAIYEKTLMDERPDIFWNIIRHHGTYRIGAKAYNAWINKKFS